MKSKRMINFQHYKYINMNIFIKYIAIAMHVRRDYTDVLLQNISQIQSYPSRPAEVIPQNSFPCSISIIM